MLCKFLDKIRFSSAFETQGFYAASDDTFPIRHFQLLSLDRWQPQIPSSSSVEHEAPSGLPA
jgi:hypothetical protein